MRSLELEEDSREVCQLHACLRACVVATRGRASRDDALFAFFLRLPGTSTLPFVPFAFVSSYTNRVT